MGIIRTVHDKNNPYFMLNREAVEDSSLSFKAVGLHTYLMSKPDNWIVREADLAARHKEGTTAVRSAIKELRDAGYITTKIIRGDDGRIASRETYVHECPQRGKPTPRLTEDIVSNDPLVSNEGSEGTPPDVRQSTLDFAEAEEPVQSQQPVGSDSKTTQGAYTNPFAARGPGTRSVDAQHSNRGKGYGRDRKAREFINAGRQHGLSPKETVALQDALLKATGNLSLANLQSPEGEITLNEGKNWTVNMMDMGVTNPAQVEALLQLFHESWSPDHTPSYKQLAKLVDKLGTSAKKPQHQGEWVTQDDGTQKFVKVT